MATIARNEYPDLKPRRVLSLKGASGHLKLAQADDMARPFQSLGEMFFQRGRRDAESGDKKRVETDRRRWGDAVTFYQVGRNKYCTTGRLGSPRTVPVL